MASQIVSLAFYAQQAKKGGATAEQLSGEESYLDVLPRYVNFTKAQAAWDLVFEADDVLVPLSEIDVAQTDYREIVDQIFRGVPFQTVRLSAVAAPPPPPTHAPYFPKYLATLSNDTRTSPAVTASLDRVNEVLATRGGQSVRANGLIVGRVQSGKTRNYIGLMLKAMDEGWNVIFVLTSSNTFLAKQTRDRIVREFGPVGANDPRFACELNFMTSGQANRVAGAELDDGFVYWGVSMKEVHGLESIRKWLDMPGQPYASMRVLIVDDESDNASPDSNAGGQGVLDDEAIAERIDGIRHESRFAPLADWFESLLQREWPEIGANTREAEVFGEINTVLTGNGSGPVKMETIINDGEIRNLLGMEQFSDPPVENLIKDFFGHQGRGEDSPNGFVLLLRSILDIVRGRSAINAALCRLVGPDPQTGEYAYPFRQCCYLGYTATPYANILNEGPGRTPIYADFIQSLDIPPQYFGAEAIFGTDLDHVPPRMPIVNPITDAENALFLAPLRAGELTVDEDLAFVSEKKEKDWASLKEAIAWAFCTAAARRHARQSMTAGAKEKIDNRWTTMLVNVDHTQPVHATVREAIKRYLDAQLETPESRDAFRDSCQAVWDRQTAQFPAQQFEALFNGDADAPHRYGLFAVYPAWEEIERHLDFFLENAARHVHVVVMNCTEEGSEAKRLYNQDPNEVASKDVMELTDDHLWIVSGGNTISRGLTLLGLATSYFDRLREGTCVDTITQMGRWFGYRAGYELLPRIWMNAQTVFEMKRIAVLEQRLHASIADNFAQHYSPADPAHYQQISSWGRQLSGRAFATRSLEASVGTIAATSEFYRDVAKRRRIAELSRAFLDRCGSPVVRDPDAYAYASSPLWERVPREEIQRFLEQLLPLYPDKSRRILRGLLREISANADGGVWDVVIGNPARTQAEAAQTLGVPVGCATPRATPAGADAIQFSARLHMAFYAMIPNVYLNRADVEILAKWRLRIFDALDAKRIQNDGTLPPYYDAALPGRPDEALQARFNRLIDELRRANGDRPLPEPIHARLGEVAEGFRNRSSGEYMANVHRAANHRRPTLQLLLVRPDGEPADDVPYVSVSFYWPDHDPTGFFAVAVDENPGFVTMVTKRGFCQTVEDILRRHDFPMQRRELLRETLERLGLRCNENFFSANIAHPLAGYEYHAMAGRNAYCINGWAADEEARLKSEFASAALDVLRRAGRPLASQDLLDATVAAQPKFRDFFTRHGDLDALLTDDVLSANDVAVTCRRPITYQYRA